MTISRQVVITGMGAVSGAGVGWKPLWRAARDGKSAVRVVDFGREYRGRIKIGVQVADFNVAELIEDPFLACSDPFTQYA
jgi:nodulation protein E